MAKICFVLTTTPWFDRRQYWRQAPALVSDGHEVRYMAVDPHPSSAPPFKLVELSCREGRMARRTGGLNLLKRIRRLQPDVVHICSVELLLLGIALKALTRTRVVYDCREDMYHSMLHSKLRFPVWQRRLLAQATRITEGLAVRWFDGLVTADPGTWELHRGMPPERKIVFFNTALLEQFSKDYLPLDQREYDVALLGGMSERAGIHVLLEACDLLAKRQKQVRILLIGEPEPKDGQVVEEKIKSLGWEDKVNITGKIPHENVPEVLRQAKIGLVLLLDYPKFRKNIACKAFEYMACGMPTVSCDLPPERLFLRDGHNALYFEPGDSEGLAMTIERLLGDPLLARRMGTAARFDAESRWNCEHEQAKLRQFYRLILSKSPRRFREGITGKQSYRGEMDEPEMAS